MGRGDYADRGPLRLGTAFIERGRCLPWAMEVPCIVCQENCPVSPKAIFTREIYLPIREATPRTVAGVAAGSLRLTPGDLVAERYAGGDFFAVPAAPGDFERRRILGNSADRLYLAADAAAGGPLAGQQLKIAVRLQQPQVAPEHCIGCGICTHECPVSGRSAIRVTAENATREPDHAMLL